MPPLAAQDSISGQLTSGSPPALPQLRVAFLYGLRRDGRDADTPAEDIYPQWGCTSFEAGTYRPPVT